MAFKVETGLLNPETAQYAGQGQAKPTIADIAAAARRIEALGFDGVCTPEAGHDPFLPLMIAAEHTTTLRLGTNVAIAFPRSPMVTAQLAWDLQQLSGGRFALGLGTQVKGHNELRYATPWTGGPGPRLREYLQCLRAMFDGFTTGKVTTVEGRHYRFGLLPPFFNPGPIDYPPPPIHIAAVNTYMAKLGGELCDGLRLHPIGTFAYTKAVVLPAIAAGAAKSGRALADVSVIGAPFLATGKTEADVAKATQALKQHVAFYASTRTYHTVLAHHGWEEIGTRLHQLSREGKWQELPALVTDDMLAEWAVIATHDRLAAEVRTRCAGIFSTVLLDLPGDLARDEERVRDIVRALHH
ncbi:MAG: TIGR03617 family F420-dependent LLM class oxidoreductase [Deltaproteobacteria bacterium]|nr:TIGR03617 family F420-dependent LLM class oxidoreductase [Deltaproteobacteria bacterium]